MANFCVLRHRKALALLFNIASMLEFVTVGSALGIEYIVVLWTGQKFSVPFPMYDDHGAWRHVCCVKIRERWVQAVGRHDEA